MSQPPYDGATVYTPTHLHFRQVQRCTDQCGSQIAAATAQGGDGAGVHTLAQEPCHNLDHGLAGRQR